LSDLSQRFSLQRIERWLELFIDDLTLSGSLMFSQKMCDEDILPNF